MIEKILKEINRLKKELKGYSASEALDYIESYINIISREPASEDLEEYYKKEFLPNEWFAKPGQRTVSEFNFFTAKHFAEWQKQKDQKTIELAEDHAMLAGMEKMRGEMMKDAVEAEVMYPASSSTLQIRYKLPKNTKLKYGDKVKIIIIKEK